MEIKRFQRFFSLVDMLLSLEARFYDKTVISYTEHGYPELIVNPLYKETSALLFAIKEKDGTKLKLPSRVSVLLLIFPFPFFLKC